jgi:hypothetical protein
MTRLNIVLLLAVRASSRPMRVRVSSGISCDGPEMLMAATAPPCPGSQIAAATRLLWEICKQLVEPSSAVVLAAVLAQPERFAGRRVGLVLSGGNVDLDAPLPWTEIPA